MNMIAITFPEVKVNAPVQGLTFDTLENMIFDITQTIACKVFEKALADIDSNLRHQREKGLLKNTGKRKKYFLTRFGDICYTRTRYRDKAGKSHYLLDEALSIIKNQRISLSRAMIESYLATASSYREVITQARLFTGSHRSHEAVRQSVIKEAKGLIEAEKKRLQQIRNLNYPDNVAPDTAYLEADATYLTLQGRSKKKRKLEVKVGVGYTGRESRYGCGSSKRLKEKFTFIGTGRKFMETFSLEAEARLSLSHTNTIIFGGDGDNWITSGVKDYFPSATYVLCLYHLNKRLREALARRKPEQKVIRDLLLENQIDKALKAIDQIIRHLHDQKEKDLLTKLYTYLSRNREGIGNQCRLREKRVEAAGAIESNINQVIASRFKKRGMSWSEKGALPLLKVKETILNGEWDTWWTTGRRQRIKIAPHKPPLSASHFKKAPEVSPLLEATLPAFSGPDQDKPWVSVLRKLNQVSYV
ncbi:MAG: ISLre2 family transposase [Candidatus Caldatribacteriota bacterium]|nr:ISLre2 family transposase [Candidatus Caldatribacteriota bacterium]